MCVEPYVTYNQTFNTSSKFRSPRTESVIARVTRTVLHVCLHRSPFSSMFYITCTRTALSQRVTFYSIYMVLYSGTTYTVAVLKYIDKFLVNLNNKCLKFISALTVSNIGDYQRAIWFERMLSGDTPDSRWIRLAQYTEISILYLDKRRGETEQIYPHRNNIQMVTTSNRPICLSHKVFGRSSNSYGQCLYILYWSFI